MKILELFSGTESFSKVAKKRGHEVFTIDNDPQFNPDLCKDMFKVKVEDIPFNPDIIWASPPCQKFSVATIGRNWNKDGTPKNKETKEALELLNKTLNFIYELKPKYFIIENPRGMMRKKLTKLDKTTVSYCQYGDTRMKPTDLFHNIKGFVGKCCKNGSPCHTPAPRGSRTGTQGLKNAKDRGVIPEKLCEEILKEIEKRWNTHLQ